MKTRLLSLAASLIAASALATTSGTDLFVPAIAHATGVEVDGVAAQWRGDIWVFNPSTTETANVSIYLLVRSQGNPSPMVRTLGVSPGQTLYLPDVVLGTFGMDNTWGALHLTSTVPVTVTGVSYDANVTVANKGVGPAGQFFSATPADFAIGAGTSTDIIGLDQDGAGTTGNWRSAVAMVETTGTPVDLLLERLDSLGASVGSMTFHLDGFGAAQINNVLTTVAASTGSNQRIRVSAAGGTGRVIVAGSRINNTTGDPSTVEMTGTHLSGAFQGLLLTNGGTDVDGGIKLVLGSGVLTSFRGVAGIPCGSSSSTVEFTADVINGPVAFNPDGTFSTIVSIPYANGANVAFTTDWTLTGARNPDGTWGGTLVSNTHGGAGDFASCNAVGVTRQWQAGWTGSS
jgi:hypothetical protein